MKLGVELEKLNSSTDDDFGTIPFGNLFFDLKKTENPSSVPAAHRPLSPRSLIVLPKDSAVINAVSGVPSENFRLVSNSIVNLLKSLIFPCFHGV